MNGVDLHVAALEALERITDGELLASCRSSACQGACRACRDLRKNFVHGALQVLRHLRKFVMEVSGVRGSFGLAAGGAKRVNI